MIGEKIDSARSALDRFLYDLLDPQDEIFLQQFSNDPVLLQGWTTDRRLLSRALGRLTPHGGTAMYDAVADAVPLVQRGQFRKKALVVISDGNDTSSTTRIRDVQATHSRERVAGLRRRHRLQRRAFLRGGAAASSSSGVRRFRFRSPSRCREAVAGGRGRRPSRPASLAGRRPAPIR